MSKSRNSWRDALSEAIAGLLRPLPLPTSRFIYLLVFALVFTLGAHRVWQRHAKRILSDERYTLTTDKIQLSPPAPWLKTVDIKTRAFRDGSLAGLKFTQRDLTVRVADAFAMQPWIARIKYPVVKKYGRVVVNVEYRRPVAMVWGTLPVNVGRDASGKPQYDPDKLYVFPVDAEGVLLPTQDFTEQQADHDYLHVEVSNTWPAGGAGSPWGDARVHGAAAIAAVLLDHWKVIGLDRVVVDQKHDATGAKTRPTYGLLARNGCFIRWGSAPGQESSGEVASSQKIDHLLKIVQEQRTLPPNRELDVSGLDRQSVAGRPG